VAGKYRPRFGCSKPAARRCCLLGTDRRNRQTDTVLLHRRLPREVASVNNQRNRKRSNRISTVNFLRFVKRYARCKDAFYAIVTLCRPANAMTCQRQINTSLYSFIISHQKHGFKIYGDKSTKKDFFVRPELST